MQSASCHLAPANERIGQMLSLLEEELPIVRRVLHAGERVYHAGDRFESLHVIHAGFFKTLDLSADGRERVVGLHFKGDWLGFDGIAERRFDCDAVAMDTGEVWSIRYDDLLERCSQRPALMSALHEAMSREMARDRGDPPEFVAKFRQGFQDHIYAALHPKGYAGWPIWAASARKPA